MIFAQNFIEKRYFHELEGGSSSGVNYTGMYENKLFFINTSTNELVLADRENNPIFIVAMSNGIEDNFKGNGNGVFSEFIIDSENNYSEIQDYDIGGGQDICKDNNENIYFVNFDGKLFAYDEGGNHTELFDCGAGYLFI